jgi:DnaJ-class molecular chaperone
VFSLADEVLSDEKKRILYDQVGEQDMPEDMTAGGFCGSASPGIFDTFVGDRKNPFNHEKDCKVS